MKRNVLFGLLLAGIIGMSFIACSNTTDSGGGGGGGSLSIANTAWTDSLNPETTIQFTANQLTLGGAAVSGGKNWYWGALDGQSYSFDVLEDADAIRDIVDRVEDNWATNFALPDALIVVWTDPTNNVGFQIYYYKAASGKYNYERLVSFGFGQPHEFKKQ